MALMSTRCHTGENGWRRARFSYVFLLEQEKKIDVLPSSWKNMKGRLFGQYIYIYIYILCITWKKPPTKFWCIIQLWFCFWFFFALSIATNLGIPQDPEQLESHKKSQYRSKECHRRCKVQQLDTIHHISTSILWLLVKSFLRKKVLCALLPLQHFSLKM